MGLLLLNRLLSMQREQKSRRQIQARNGLVIPVPQNKDSLCQEEDGHSQSGERSLPEDIWCHIHSLMPLRDSARSACVSHAFLCSWRCHSKLTFTEETLGLKEKGRQKSIIARDFTSRVDQILKNHSGTGRHSSL
uniref:F-box domain-containing protein n=1 Tax=Arundo donax TaxID=35708 RepID=A0A0A9EQC6_ARUDO